MHKRTEMSDVLGRYVFNFNFVILVLLTLQNSAFVILSSYTQQRARTDPSRIIYNASHLLLMVEVVKFFMSIGWCLYNIQQEMKIVAVDQNDKEVDCAIVDDDARPQSPSTVVLHMDNAADMQLIEGKQSRAIWRRFRTELSFTRNNYEALLMGIPAILYAIQNGFALHALKCLDPTIFQITYQLRILMTAVAMRLMMGTIINSRKWTALVVLFLGVCAAQLGAKREMGGNSSGNGSANAATDAATNAANALFVAGMISVLIAVSFSTFSSVLMEFIFKTRSNKCLLSTRNIHLSFFSIVYFCLVSLQEFNKLRSSEDVFGADKSLSNYLQHYLDGFDWLVWVLVVIQAVGGIIVAMIMRYSDNIMKTFATAAAIVVSGVASVFVFGLQLNFLYVSGCTLVIASLVAYNLS